MKKGCHSADIINFFRFMRLFGISLFSILSATERQIGAIIAWADDCQKGLPEYDDTQEVLWHIPAPNNIDDALRLGELMYDKGWILSDKITVSMTELQNEINWEMERFKKSVETLLSIKVSMIDDGKETDTFFLHLE